MFCSKCFSNIHHEMFDKQYTVHIKQHCLSNVLKTFYQKRFFKPIFLNLHLQTCPNKDGGEQ